MLTLGPTNHDPNAFAALPGLVMLHLAAVLLCQQPLRTQSTGADTTATLWRTLIPLAVSNTTMREHALKTVA